jgi:hypothetical protein
MLARLDFMGLKVKDAPINHLQRHEMIPDDAHYYSLNDIEKQTREIFGREATGILVAKVKDGIRAQHCYLAFAQWRLAKFVKVMVGFGPTTC